MTTASVARDHRRTACVRLIAVLLLAAVCGCGCAGVDRAFYFPDGKVYHTPGEDGLAYEDVDFRSADGTRLTGWFIPAPGRALGTVIHFHGNGQNMTSHYRYVSWLPKEGFNLFLFDYRGYGRSEGLPSRRGVYEDSVAALHCLLGREDVDPAKVVVFGQSLGAATAIAVVGNNEFGGLCGVVAEAAFSSYDHIAEDHVSKPLEPVVRGVVRNHYDPVQAVAGISPVPLVLIHGAADRVVPYDHATRLYAAAGEPKELWTIDGGGHLHALVQFGDDIRPRLLRLLRRWLVGKDD